MSTKHPQNIDASIAREFAAKELEAKIAERTKAIREQNAELMHALEILAESWSGDFDDEIEYCRMVRKIAGDAYRKAALAKQEATK